VLLVSSSKYPERWIIPGGGVEADETSGAETAVREVLEEAGVLGRLGRCLGIFEVSRKKNSFSVTPN
jgi:diphosphoinositol-polyphosphate diphosphatase